MHDNTATQNWTNMKSRKNNKMRTCLPSGTSGKAVADVGNCDLEPLPVSCLWNTTILIGTCVQTPGIFQDGWMQGTSSCSVARLIGLNWSSDCGAETSWIVFRTEVEHGENKTSEAIEPVLPTAAGASRLWQPKLGTPALRNRGLLPGVFGLPLPADMAASNSLGLLQELRSVCAWGWILASSSLPEPAQRTAWEYE